MSADRHKAARVPDLYPKKAEASFDRFAFSEGTSLLGTKPIRTLVQLDIDHFIEAVIVGDAGAATIRSGGYDGPLIEAIDYQGFALDQQQRRAGLHPR